MLYVSHITHIYDFYQDNAPGAGSIDKQEIVVQNGPKK